MKELLMLAVLLAPLASGVEGPFVDLTFEEACAQAKASERVVFIDFYTTWCERCKDLDAVTWKDDKVIAWLGQNTVALKVDAEKQVELAERFKVKAYPTLVFAKPSGELQGQINGYRTPTDFLSQAEDVLAGVKRSDHFRERISEEGKNPMTVMRLAIELAWEGSSEEALELYLWCWEHGAEPPNESFVQLRSSFVMSNLGHLARTYPPAKDALQKRRDIARELVLGERPTRAVTADLVVLNGALKQSKQTLEVYDVLSSRVQGGRQGQRPGGFDPLRELFDAVVSPLLRAKRYRDVIAGYGEPRKWFDAEKERFELRTPTSSSNNLGHDALRRDIVMKSRQLYRALLSTGEHDAAAGELAAKIVAFSPSAKTWIALMRTARFAKREDIRSTLRQQGLEVLPEEDRGKLPK